MKKASRFHLDKADLLCKNKCGFYGNTLWKGYCSVCYKTLQKCSYQTTISSNVAASSKPHQNFSKAAETSSFLKFEEKRKAQAEKTVYTVKKIFQRKPTKESSSKPQSSQVVKNRAILDPDTHQETPSAGRGEFSRFLNRLGVAVYQDISKRTHTFLSKFKSMPIQSTVEMWSDAVQDFYQSMSDHCSESSLYQNFDENTINELHDGLEKYIMGRLYNAVFCPIITDDEDQDLALQRRIRNLHWVTIQQLEANICESDLGVRATLEKAITAIIELDTKKAPKDKLDCIVSCSRHIFEALNLSSKVGDEHSPAVASADDFLPVFIFIILKANPPRLKSNINFITRFACPLRLNSGEGGYFFTNMCCVVDFVEKLNEEALNLTTEQFNSYMSGDAIPEGTNNVYMCEGLRLLHTSLQMIDRIKKKQDQCMEKTLDLQEKMHAFRTRFDSEINDMVTRSPLQLKPRKAKVDLDNDEDIPQALPLPLVPEQA